MYTTCSELGIFMYSTGNSMNNLSSYCGIVNERIRASDKDLPVSKKRNPSIYMQYTLRPEGLENIQCCFLGADPHS